MPCQGPGAITVGRHAQDKKGTQRRPGLVKCHTRRPYPRKWLHMAQCQVIAVSTTSSTVICLRLTVEKDWL